MTTTHTHSFSVDTSCECGVMLSDYVRSLVVINADLIAALNELLKRVDDTVLGRVDLYSRRPHCSPESRPMTSSPTPHEKCEHHAGTFYASLRDFRLAWINLVATGQKRRADDLLYEAHVFENYVYIFHDGADFTQRKREPGIQKNLG
jgi:hypothetical protein